MSASASASVSMWSLLGSRGPFRLLWSARTFSFFGDTLARTALLLHVQQVEGSGWAVGALLLAMAAPRLAGPLAGTLADRVDQRRLMLATDAAQIPVVGAMAWFLPPLPLLLALVTMSTLLSTLFSPAGRSAIPDLVASEQLGPANSLIGTGVNVGMAAGPAVAGLLFASYGVRGPLLVNLLTFAGSLVLLLRLPSLRPVSDSLAGFWVGVREGVVVIRSNAVAKAATLGLLLLVAFLALDNVATVFLAQDVLQAGPEGFGLMGSAWGLGMIVGSLAMVRASRRIKPGSLFLLGALCSGVGVLAAAASPTIALAVVAFGVGGLGNGVDNVAVDTLIQQHVPRGVRGRVFGFAHSGALAGESMASFLGGPLVDATSARTALAVAGIGALGVLGLVKMMMPRQALGSIERPAGSRTDSQL